MNYNPEKRNEFTMCPKCHSSEIRPTLPIPLIPRFFGVSTTFASCCFLVFGVAVASGNAASGGQYAKVGVAVGCIFAVIAVLALVLKTHRCSKCYTRFNLN